MPLFLCSFLAPDRSVTQATCGLNLQAVTLLLRDRYPTTTFNPV